VNEWLIHDNPDKLIYFSPFLLHVLLITILNFIIPTELSKARYIYQMLIDVHLLVLNQLIYGKNNRKKME
jgi:hypothetical protein